MRAVIKFTTSLVVPMLVLITAMVLVGLPLESSAAIAVTAAFMVVKVMLQHFLFDPVSQVFIASKREGEFRAYSMIAFSLLALGILQLFTLIAKH